MSSIEATFHRCRAEGRLALLGYLTAGYPTPADTVPLVEAIVSGGFDIVELGVPFSDPLADGPTIQRASQTALANGMNVRRSLEITAELGARLPVPIVLMGYYNPFFRYGLDRLAAEADEAGVQGFIVPDLPSEEAADLQAVLAPRGMDYIGMLAPTSDATRMEAVCRDATGFIYCVSLAGVTGARATLSAQLPEFLGRVREHTSLPLAVGFGLSRPEHIKSVAKVADGAVVGSAIIGAIDAASPQRRQEHLRTYAESLRAAARLPRR
ncbi:MAG: tryptophan synthase subunit alpha [Dehalococcoidales bacterium]|nr:tryptophan synthase subunit alpha [Dehalococcoidales bacterium]